MCLGYVIHSHDSVLKKGEELLKKKASGVNLDDPNLISRLFLLFNGMEHVLCNCCRTYNRSVILSIKCFLKTNFSGFYINNCFISMKFFRVTYFD